MRWASWRNHHNAQLRRLRERIVELEAENASLRSLPLDMNASSEPIPRVARILMNEAHEFFTGEHAFENMRGYKNREPIDAKTLRITRGNALMLQAIWAALDPSMTREDT